MEMFSRFAGCSGFFLDPDRFARSFYAPEPFGHHLRPSKALLSAVYLSSVALSGDVTLTTHEPIFLSRALYYASQAPSCTHPSSVKHALQAEILIANYFFLRGHILEGKSHICTAMLIATVHRAHKICRISNLEGVGVIEQWERVKGFWLAYFFDKLWSIAGCLPSTSPDGFTEETRIDAPWPLEPPQFKNVSIFLDVSIFRRPTLMNLVQIQPEQEVRGYDTINRFLANPAASFAEEDVSTCTMACKAVILFDRAHSFGLSWTAGLTFQSAVTGRDTYRFLFAPFTLATSDETRAGLRIELAVMRQATQAFKDTIAPLAVGANIQDPLVTIHMMILLASIRLDVSPTWTKNSVENALAAVALVDDTSFEYIGNVNPILGFLLTAVGQVLVDELIRIRGLASKLEEDTEQEAKMKNATDRLTIALRACGAECPYICE